MSKARSPLSHRLGELGVTIPCIYIYSLVYTCLKLWAGNIPVRSLIEFPRSMVSCFVEKLRLPLAGQEEIEQKNQKREKKGGEGSLRGG